MKKFAVIGMGRFGMRLARLLTEGGAEVIAVDRRKELIEEVRDDVTRPVCLDATDEEALRSQGIDEVDVAIVGIGGNFEAAVLTTVLLKQLGVSRVISRAASSIRARILSRVGADEIVNPEQESADRWRNRLVATNIVERIELAEDFSLVQMAAPAIEPLDDRPPVPETRRQAAARHARVAERREGVLVICHRSALEFAHENTLEAFRAALELGADGSEIDIRETRDGVLVCFHDDMLDMILAQHF